MARSYYLCRCKWKVKPRGSLHKVIKLNPCSSLDLLMQKIIPHGEGQQRCCPFLFALINTCSFILIPVVQLLKSCCIYLFCIFSFLTYWRFVKLVSKLLQTPFACESVCFSVLPHKCDEVLFRGKEF